MRAQNPTTRERKSDLEEIAEAVVSPAENKTNQPPPRVVIESVEPQIDGGRFPVKRIIGDQVVVTADVFTDGHDALAAVLRYRHVKEADWKEAAMLERVNDAWRASFPVTKLGYYEFTVHGWVDHFRTWRRDFQKKAEAGQDVSVDLLVGAQMVEETSARAAGEDAGRLEAWAAELRSFGPGRLPDGGLPMPIQRALEPGMASLMARYPDRRLASAYEKSLRVHVDGPRSRSSAWYEMFPRSCSSEAGRHGTFRDCEERLGYIAQMGFDVVYFPPVHPIGHAFRKGKNNSPTSNPGDPGSPWAIGSSEGGHKGIHPELGTLDDFKRLLGKAREHGIEIALDIAFQCCPDHPYVASHPEWFRRRPDGSIQYAENPPKKYQDIYPFEFETEHWRGLWEELKSVVDYWIAQGVRIFRVDNPHTKPFAFWEWVIAEVKNEHPETIFLSEAFTRPKIMYRLAKLGFTHSYTYFAWRNTKWELTQYFTELTQTKVREFFRPHLWPNTPDILTEYLQRGGRAAFIARLVLAATLGANYGIYGPAFELCENRALVPGKEEYLDAEKYEIRHWDLGRPDSLKEIIGRVNAARRSNPALQRDEGLRFHDLPNDQLIAYTKSGDDGANLILVVVNLDPYYTQSGFVELPLEQLGIDPNLPFAAHDLLTDARYVWKGPWNYVELNPQKLPAHILRIRPE